MNKVFNYRDYTHDADRAALKALQAIPGFSSLTKAFMNVWNERQQKILNMSSRIRLGPNQMSKYYNMLPPICEKLGIPVPELYLEMNVVPNAYTSGDTNPFIVVTSGLLKALPDELVPTVLAHECGHIACRHVLFLTMGRIVLHGAGGVLSSVMRLGALLTVPMQIAFYYWMRCSEFSADRAAVLCDGTPARMQEVCMRLAGWDREIDADVNMDAFLAQAADYRNLINESKWNKALEFMILSGASHPLMAVRATECGTWFGTESYRRAAGASYLPEGGTRESLHAQSAEDTPADGEDRPEADGSAPAPDSTGPAPESTGPVLGFTPPVDLGAAFRSLSDRIGSFFTDPGEPAKPAEPAAPAKPAEPARPAEADRLRMPDEYQALPSKPGDPENSKSYGRITTQADCFVQVFPQEADMALPFGSVSAALQAVRLSLGADRGVVEVNTGATASGKPFVYSIVKSAADGGGVEYTLNFQIRQDDAIAAVRGYFTETGSPGFREAAIRGRLSRDLPPESAANLEHAWRRDPYDRNVREGFLMNLSEEQQYDARYPLHPLSLARSFVVSVAALN